MFITIAIVKMKYINHDRAFDKIVTDSNNKHIVRVKFIIFMTQLFSF